MADELMEQKRCVFCTQLLIEIRNELGGATWMCDQCGMMGKAQGSNDLVIEMMPNCPKCGLPYSVVAMNFVELRVGCIGCGTGLVDPPDGAKNKVGLKDGSQTEMGV